MTKAYHAFAEVYDSLMDSSLYDQWFEFTMNHLQKGAKTLELGAGTGNLAIQLCQAGFLIHALDLSNEMLTVAYNNQLEAGVRFPLIERSMTDLRGLGKYDQVISFADSICYLSDLRQVQKVFTEVYQILTKGGIFLFDVHSLERMKKYDKFSYHGETERGVLLWDSYLGKDKASVEHELSVFLSEEGNTYTRYNELHKERTYPLAIYLQALEQAGFEKIEYFSDFKDSFEENGDRWFFKAYKGTLK